MQLLLLFSVMAQEGRRLIRLSRLHFSVGDGVSRKEWKGHVWFGETPEFSDQASTEKFVLLTMCFLISQGPTFQG